jgi:hypothetical protein
MIPERPVAMRDSLGDRNRSSEPLGARNLAGCDRDDDLDDAVWLYAWSHDALHPIGEAVVDRVVIAG